MKRSTIRGLLLTCLILDLALIGVVGILARRKAS